MITLLLIEVVLAALLAAFLGFLIGRQDGAGPRGALTVLGITLTFDLLLAMVAFAGYIFGYFPLNHLGSLSWWYPSNAFGFACLALEFAIWALPLSAALGYLLNRKIGAGILALFVSFCTLLLLIFIFLLNISVLSTLFWLPAAAFFVIGLVGALPLAKLARSTKAWRWQLVWVVGYGIFLLSYVAAGRLGLLLLALPACGFFCVALYIFAQKALPLTADQHGLGFRSMLTFALGNNFDYYLIEDWQTQENHDQTLPKPCVPGSVFRQFFSGPGIIYNDATHVAVVWDGFKYRVAPPGVSFTNIFEQLYAVVDLRPQLRVCTIPAETQDGILTKTLVFMPHRTQTPEKEPRLGASYPYTKDAVLRAVCGQSYVDHKWWQEEDGAVIEEMSRIPWYELVLVYGPPALKEVIVERKCTELFGEGDPRLQIAQAFRQKLTERIQPLGIELVGGGISNINLDERAQEQLLENWAADWKRRIEIEVGLEEAEITKHIEPIWASVQIEVMEELIGILKLAGEISEDVLAFQLVEALGAEPPETQNVQGITPDFAWSLRRRGR